MKSLRKLPKEKLQQLILVAILTTIGVAAMVVFWIGKEIESLSSDTEQIAKLSKEVRELETKARQDTNNQPRVQQMTAFVEPLRETMVTGDAYMWAVREIRLREEQHPGVPILGISMGGRGSHPRCPDYEVCAVSIELEGTYDQIGVFLRDFENNYPTGEIRSLSLGTAEGPRRHASLQLTFLMYPEAKLGPKVKEEPKKSS
jgi:hypothetical protein